MKSASDSDFREFGSLRRQPCRTKQSLTDWSMKVRINRVIPTSNPSDSSRKPNPKSTYRSALPLLANTPSSSSYARPDDERLVIQQDNCYQPDTYLDARLHDQVQLPARRRSR